jgi:putative SOS response-associated peptidase YedK
LGRLAFRRAIVNTLPMCARLVVVLPDLSVLVAPFGVIRRSALPWQPRFNIAPTQLAPVITNERERRLEFFQFGLVSSWAKERKIASKLINARAEGVATRNAFKTALAQRRCIVPISGYYEWQTLKGQKRPLYIHDARGEIMPLAGIWERWRSPEGVVLESFAILTRAAVGFLQDVHDRMPLEVPRNQLDRWLDPDEQSADALAQILTAHPPLENLTAHAVAPSVNSPKYDAPDCIEPYSAPEPPPERQLDLFGAPSSASRAASGERGSPARSRSGGRR